MVLAAHVEIIRAGADMIQTNACGANADQAQLARFEDRVEKINEAGAKIAREAREIAGRDMLDRRFGQPERVLDVLAP